MVTVMGKKRRKGSLKETLSYALYRDDTKLFTVTYRDKDQIKTNTLHDFMEKEELAEIPITRILTIIRDGETVWSKGQKQVSVKKRSSE